jgi:hypothetical protein
MESQLLQSIEEELEILETIYTEDQVVAEKAKLINDGMVQCLFKLQPNTG